MRKLFTFLCALATSVGLSWATTNSITIYQSSHGSVVASSSSAAAGETITLTATPNDGFQLKSISGVYLPGPETINFEIEKTTVTGTNFQCVGTMINSYGWRVYNPETAQTLTVSSLNGTTLIEKIEFTSASLGDQRKNNMLSVSAGTLSFDGNDPSTTVTINDINATSVTISGSGTNAGQTWCIKSVKVYYEGTDEEELEISDTENANVKTFTMVDGEVAISAEFEPAPAPSWVKPGDAWGEATKTLTVNSSPGNEAYFGKTEIEHLIISNSVERIGEHAFYGCTGMTSVTFGNSLYNIERSAFYGCTGLTSITIPNSVWSIERGAFSGCSGLTSIEIPNSVERIEQPAFAGCTGLTSVVVASGNTKYDSRENCNAIIETSSNTLFFGCKKTIIPNSVTSIGEAAFSGCSGLTSIEIPNSVTSIGAVAFQDCSGLTSVTIPEGVTSIGDWAFDGCSGLTSITMPNSVTSIGQDAFRRCTSLPVIDNIRYADTYLVVVTDKTKTSYTIKEGTKFIGSFAFDNCNGLTSITIPNSVTSIGEAAFGGCSGLTSVTIGNSVTSIGKNAFASCEGLTSIEIPNNVTSIGSSAFYWCTGLTSVTIGNSVTSIGYQAFYNCYKITSVIWNAKNCNGWNFGNNVESFTFGDNVKVIPASLCSGMNKLSSISIPSSVTSIGESAFSGCSGLTSITIPNGVTSIGNSAFSGCSGLTSIEIPNSVTSIGDDVFSGCTGLTSVTIGNSVTSIGNRAFLDCSKLESVTIPNSVTSIGQSAFQSCSGLKSVSIGNSVTSIGQSAFQSCSGLTSITIPNSVTSIGADAFFGCTAVTDVYCYPDAADLTWAENGKNDFKADGSTVCHVHTGQLSAYKTKFTDEVNVTFVGDQENVIYQDKDGEPLDSEEITLHLPDAPVFSGFTFLKWVFVAGDVADGLTIQAVYKSDTPTSAPEVYTNPANPAQKLIRNGNVYILTGDKTYTITGQMVK